MSCLKSYTTLKKSKEFGYIYNNAKKSHTNSFLLFYKKAKQRKVGFTASKKVGNSVKRNFAKRRLRAAFIDSQESLNDGIYVFIAKKELLELPFSQVKSSLKFALKKLNALSK